MKWIIGLDLRAHSGGALRFGAWLARQAPGESSLLVHVLEKEHLLYLLRFKHLDEVLADTRAAAQRAIAAGDCARYFPDVRIVQAPRADEALADAVAAESASGLVVGRIANRGSRPLVRLGRVARRLVRHLPAPLVIVPPDFVEVGGGPVVALTSLDSDSVRACRFARDLSRVAARSLAVLHVVTDPVHAAPYGLQEPAIAQLRAEGLAAARKALASWLAAAEVDAELTEVLVGDVVESALAFSAEKDALLVVTGARRRHSVQRLYAPSVGRELAAEAPRPVAIVASDAA